MATAPLTPEQKLVNVFKTSDKTAKNSWAYVGDIYSNNQGLLFVPETDEEEKAFKKRINEAFTTHLTNQVGDLVPTHGISRSTGKRMELRSTDKDGTVRIKWSTWEGAGNTIKNLTFIGRLIFLTGDVNSIFTDKGKLKSKGAMVEQIKELSEEKSPETPYQTITRCIEMASSKLTDLKDVEEAQAVAALATKLYTDSMEALESLKVPKAA